MALSLSRLGRWLYLALPAWPNLARMLGQQVPVLAYRSQDWPTGLCQGWLTDLKAVCPGQAEEIIHTQQWWVFWLESDNSVACEQDTRTGTMKATVTNPKGSVEKLSSKESSKDGHTVLRGADPKDNVSIRGTS